MDIDHDIVLRIQCDLKSFHCKRRFPTFQWTLGDFRSYVEQLLDINTDNLIIFLHSQELSTDEDNVLLSDIKNLYSNDTFVIDSHHRADDIDDVNRLPDKYRMSDEIYAQRKGTLRHYLEANKLGKYSGDQRLVSSSTNNQSQKRRQLHEANRMKLQRIEIGMRVRVIEPPLNNTREGEVAYVGVLRGIRDEFVGALFNGPWGDSNGCDGIIRYFDAKRKHASFIRPEYVDIILDNSKESQ